MKKIPLTTVAVIVALLAACQSPVANNTPPAPPSSLDLSQPGKVLQQISLANGALPATANGGRSLTTPRGAGGRAVFDPSTTGRVIVSSQLVNALANASVNIAEIYLKGLKTSAAATADNLAVGEVVSVGAISMVMGSSTTQVADAGRLTTRLSDDGTKLQYYWNLGPQMASSEDMWFVLNVFTDGRLELYAQISATMYMKSTSNPSGLVHCGQFSGGSAMAVVSDAREAGTLRSAVLSDTFITLVSATPANAALLTIQSLNQATPWYSFEAYDAGGDLLVTAGGSKTAPSGDTVELAGAAYTHGKSFRLKALTPLAGFSWARAQNGTWYTWPQPAPSRSWDGASTDNSGANGPADVEPFYDFWLENPSTNSSVFDDGDVTLGGLGWTTMLYYDTATSKHRGALVQTMSEQNVAATVHLDVSTAANTTFSSAWSRILADLTVAAAFSASSFLSDVPTVMTEASALMPSFSN